MDLRVFYPESDEQVQSFLDYVRYSEDAYRGVIPPSEQLSALTTSVDYLLKRIQQLESKLDS